MSLTHGMAFEDMPLTKTKKRDLMVYDEMSTWKIVRKTSYRHRVGLWATAAIVGWAFQLNIVHDLVFWYSVFFK